MDLRQLAALAAVAEAGSFSAAARRLHTVQSNVSTHVARLERELGTTLVDRSTGALTDEGEVVVDRARRVQHELESLRSDVASMLHEVSGQVRLGCIGTAAAGCSPTSSGAWPSAIQGPGGDRRRHHHVARPPGRERRLDLAVVNLPLGDRRLATEPLFDEERILARPVDHPLAKPRARSSSPSWPNTSCCSTRRARRSATSSTTRRRLGVQLRAQAEIDGVGLLASLAFEGFGAAILPATAASGWIESPAGGSPWGAVAPLGRHGHAPAGPACRPRPGPSGPSSATWWRAPTRTASAPP